MKIAFLNIYQNKVERGAETFITELSKRLSKGNKVEIIDTPISLDWSKKDSSLSFARRLFVDYWSRKVFGFTFKSIPKIFKEKYDIVVPLNGGWQPAIIRIVTWLYGGKMVISGQSGIGWDDRNNLWCFPNAFVALSSKALNWAKKAMPLVKSFYIPNGVDLDYFKPQGESFNTKLKKPVILAVGAFTEQKRMDLAIKAVAKMKGVSLLMVGGGGDLKEKLTIEGKMLLGERFEIKSVPFEEMPKIYRVADVFTLPSASSEAFGNVLVEAMATGLPVVATDDPIRREIVGDAGILVDPTDVDKYSRVLRNALETKWGDKLRKQAEKFSWDNIALRYEELFKDIFQKK